MAQQTRVRANLSKLDDMMKQFGTNFIARVGILGARAGATHDTESGMTNSQIGVIHEFGSETNNIPARSFLRMPLETRQEDLLEALDSATVKKLVEAGEIEKVYKLLGIHAEGIVKDAFRSSGYGNWPPNTPETVKKKGSSRPLIDTTKLMGAITSDVVKNRRK